MAITVPGVASNVRVPFTYFGIDNSQAGFNQQNTRILVFGEKLATGSASENSIVQVFGNQDTLFGIGSMLANQVDMILLNAPSAEIFAIPVPEAGAASVNDVTVTGGPLTKPEVINLMVGGRVYSITGITGDSNAVIASNLAVAINADVKTYVTAAVAAGVISLTSRHKGIVAGSIDVRSEYRRQRIENRSITLTVAQTTVAAGSPSLASSLAGLADEAFDWICNPYLDGPNIAVLSLELSDTAGRWGALQMLYGHAVGAMVDTPASLSTFGDTLNDQHFSVIGLFGSPTPAYLIASAVTAKCWLHLSTAPELSRPLQTILLSGVLAPEVEDVFTKSTRQSLYFDGIGSVTVGRDGKVRIDRLLTTYKTNDAGAPDNSYLDVQTMAQLQYFIRYMDARIKQRYPRHALRGDAEPVLPGQFTVRPRDIKNEMVAAAQELSNQNVIEDIAGFTERLVVQRASDSGGDPNCIEMVLSPDLVNQFRIAKVLVQFYNQYPTSA
jgi:phage tail sheath gpL-like